MKDIFSKNWIIANAIEIVSNYEKGVLTLRSLHYQLVGRGMTNDIQHYKRVANAMIQARWDNQISFDTFSDLDAVRPEKLMELLKDAIEEVFDSALHDDLMEEEREERKTYRFELKQFVNNLKD